MRFRLSIAVLTLTALAACGGFSGKLNPFHWFKRSAPAEVVTLEAPADKRPLVDDVISMQVESYPGGAIVRATGLPPSQGWWDAELVAQPIDDKGVLVLEFHVFPPLDGADVVNQQSREITVAYNLSNIKLEGISQIVVQGAKNARSSRR